MAWIDRNSPQNIPPPRPQGPPPGQERQWGAPTPGMKPLPAAPNVPVGGQAVQQQPQPKLPPPPPSRPASYAPAVMGPMIISAMKPSAPINLEVAQGISIGALKNEFINQADTSKYSTSPDTKQAKYIFAVLTDKLPIDSVVVPSTLDALKKSFGSEIDNAKMSGPAKYAAKQWFSQAVSNLANSDCKSFKLDGDVAARELYKSLPVRNPAGSQVTQLSGDAATVGHQIHTTNPNNRVGVMIAANSGMPGGGLGYRPADIKTSDLSVPTQEESVWANAVLTECGEDRAKQSAFHGSTIKGKWGLIGNVRTVQGIDFTAAQTPSAYNGAYVVKGHSLSAMENGALKKDTQYPATFVFADSVNANPSIGTKDGTMQRTLNQRAIGDQQFFRECVKTKLRSALDAMAANGVTHPVIAQLSCGIYAGNHQMYMKTEFGNILNEVLNEKVGPNQEKRSQYFDQVIIPILERKEGP